MSNPKDATEDAQVKKDIKAFFSVDVDEFVKLFAEPLPISSFTIFDYPGFGFDPYRIAKSINLKQHIHKLQLLMYIAMTRGTNITTMGKRMTDKEGRKLNELVGLFKVCPRTRDRDGVTMERILATFPAIASHLRATFPDLFIQRIDTVLPHEYCFSGSIALLPHTMHAAYHEWEVSSSMLMTPGSRIGPTRFRVLNFSKAVLANVRWNEAQRKLDGILRQTRLEQAAAQPASGPPPPPDDDDRKPPTDEGKPDKKAKPATNA